jgi:glyoxylase-like metal-dependent hydrolase (beta-lactamase superfamily II)
MSRRAEHGLPTGVLTLLRTLLLTLLAAGGAHAADAPPAAPAPVPRVSLAIIRTGGVDTLEGLLYAGGGLTTRARVNFSAFLIRHGDRTLLFDSGLGSHVAQQYQQDMPWWARPLMRYDAAVTPVRAQLDRAGLAPVPDIILSHSHWDHASGLGDFPEASVWAPEAEQEVIRHAAPGLRGAWPSQVGLPGMKWQTFAFRPVAFEGFEASLDWFGDGTVVLVPLHGHTPGSVGAFVTVSSGRRYFLVGDAVWSAAALREGRPKFWLARVVVDRDREQTAQAVERIRAVLARHPDLTVLPSHDERAQRAVGYFPAWAP